MTTEAAFDDAQLGRDLSALDRRLGDTRMRYRKGAIRGGSSEKLIALDLEIRAALQSPRSAALQAEVRSLAERLQLLDPR